MWLFVTKADLWRDENRSPRVYSKILQNSNQEEEEESTWRNNHMSS